MHIGFYHISLQKNHRMLKPICYYRKQNLKETIYSNSNILPLHQVLPKQLGLLRCLDGTLKVIVGQNTSLIFYQDPLSQSRSKYFYVLYSLYQSFRNSEFGKLALFYHLVVFINTDLTYSQKKVALKGFPNLVENDLSSKCWFLNRQSWRHLIFAQDSEYELIVSCELLII